jgi:soluble lytic murein transglycosylase-like protein
LTPVAPSSPSTRRHRRQEFDELIAGAAARYGVDENLVRAVITAESDFDPHTVSRAGAMGLMQLMPETAADLGVTDPFDPAQNIDAGTRYLAMLLERFDGDEAKALAAYNWGPSNVEAGRPLPRETRVYLERVARYKALYAQGFQRVA